VLLACSGCTLHPRWRLVIADRGPILIPPDVRAANLAQRTFKEKVARGDAPCLPGPSFKKMMGAIPIEVRGKHARVAVTTGTLKDQPNGGLAMWASAIEATHCLAPGEGLKLAGRVADSVPLEPWTALRLLGQDDRETGEVSLGPEIRLQVMSPFWRQEGVGMVDGALAVAADLRNDRHLIATGNYTGNLAGEETSFYALRPKAGNAGYTIAPLYADVHLQAEGTAKTERRPQPEINYFKFPNDAAFYRLFHKSWQTDFTALLIGGHTPAELDQLTKTLEASGDAASCEKVSGGMCIVIPKDVAVNPMFAVTVNGAEVLVPRGARVSTAIRLAGQRQPNTVLRTLRVQRPWNGRLAPVVFDPDSEAILNMPLRSGEIISWH
jgi:hypothetical protein